MLRAPHIRLAAVLGALALLATACWAPSFGAGTYAVVVTSDIVYGQGEIDGGGTFVDLRLDLYTPQGTGQAELPLVVAVHGGGFVSGSKSDGAVSTWANAFAQRGYIVASIDYRLAGTNPVPSARVQPLYDAILALGTPDAQQLGAVAAIDDTLAAIDHLLARPDTSNGPVVLVGGSAGAITIDYVAYALDDFGIDRPAIGAVVSNWGGFPVGAASAFVDNPVPTPENPYFEPPIFMAHATGDPTVPYSLSSDIAAQAAVVGLEHELYTKTANVHGFNLANENYPGGGKVLDAQVTFVTCQMYPHLADAPECS